ncbi:hypothetical protein PG993_009487 [Apiospora rasikravindrae]|uniref:Uncharacterized protein n=1 Tax=Apiospora rasikravindrae TaxID=990691 RepID=A0ABR1SJY0_9PEZI
MTADQTPDAQEGDQGAYQSSQGHSNQISSLSRSTLLGKRLVEHPLEGVVDIVLPAEGLDPLDLAFGLTVRDGAVLLLRFPIILKALQPSRHLDVSHALDERVLVKGTHQAPVELAFNILSQTRGDSGVVEGTLVDPIPIREVDGFAGPLEGTQGTREPQWRGGRLA